MNPDQPKPSREELPPGRVLCEFCTAKCCKYLALPLPDTPRVWRDFDDIRWYLSHENIAVFVDDDTWYILIYNRCKHLDSQGRCDIYHTRPRVCREYTTENCEYDDELVYQMLFETDEQIYEYAEALLGPPPATLGIAPLPNSLAIVH